MRTLVTVAACESEKRHTNVPVTALTGPGVPLELVELMVSPSTSKKVAPFDRCTRSAADPDIPSSRASTGACDGGINAREVTTPAMLFQRTTESSSSNANAAEAHNITGS